ncbi:MAG: helix-turn-helix transcriptional regulator [Bacteroidetes bacterium]|nr:helix-turn-helix transcriptional regulator [Bacteroidota bacterium]
MADNKTIYNYELLYNNVPCPFVIKTMEEIDEQSGGIADDPHRHNFYTVIWSHTATGRHIIDFKEYAIEPQTLFFVNPDQVHQIITDPKPTGYVILFTTEFLEKNSIRSDFITNLKLFQKFDETAALSVSNKMKERLSLFTSQMLTAFESKDEFAMESIGAYLKLFLIECNGHCSLHANTNTQSVEVEKTLVKSFKALVENNHFQWHQVKDYADKLNVTPNYLNEVIKSAINISAKDFIQNRLVIEAKRMVVFTDKSSKEIGYDLGFDDPSHFSKFIKSQSGQTLQDFKRSLVS